MARAKKRSRTRDVSGKSNSESNTQPPEPPPCDLSDDDIQSLVHDMKEAANTLQASDLSDSLRKIPADHPKNKVWETLCVKGEKASARYRSNYARRRLGAAIPDPQTALGRAIEAFEQNRDAQISLVKDYQSAGTCERALKGLMDFCLDWFQRWLAETRQDEAVARRFTTKLQLELLERFNSAKLHALETAEQLLAGEETQEERAERRKAVVNPLMKKVHIPTDIAWAVRAGLDRNTPRDYRNGKTKRLRKPNREALATPLEIKESELPD
jgi:hypothetical protein